MATIDIVRGSLLDQKVEAIVNAANTAMRGGAGLDGAVHKAAGPGLLQELIRVAPHGCRTGEVVVTGGHNTGFKYILHTPGPIWRGGIAGEDELLRSCYRNSVLKAQSLGVTTLGFPSISTGIFRFPPDRAAGLALEAVRNSASGLDEVVFALFAEPEYLAFRAAASA